MSMIVKALAGMSLQVRTNKSKHTLKKQLRLKALTNKYQYKI